MRAFQDVPPQSLNLKRGIVSIARTSPSSLYVTASHFINFLISRCVTVTVPLVLFAPPGGPPQKAQRAVLRTLDLTPPILKKYLNGAAAFQYPDYLSVPYA